MRERAETARNELHRLTQFRDRLPLSSLPQQVLSVNVKGYANCTKFSLPYLRKAGGGSIVNMASISSHVAQPAFLPYNTSKGAIMQMTRCVCCNGWRG